MPAVYAPAEGVWWFGRKLADWTIGLIVFLGAFVINEPAPYELLLAPIILVWLFFGLKLNRHMLPMIVLMLLYVAGGLLGLTQLNGYSDGAIYVTVTAFLAISSIFFAAVISEAPDRRFRIIKSAYIAAALIAALLGIAGYFSLFPGAELFTLYDRAKGTFQDPNVFAPFLLLPAMLLYRDLLTHRLRDSFSKVVLLLIILFGVFLAFSRAAWGMTVVSVLLITLMAYLTSSRPLDRLRIVIYFGLGILAVALLVAAALSLPAVQTLLEQRGALVESYDTGRTGRFARHIAGFFLVQERPLGLGPLVFAQLLGEDEHNMWLKGFTVYGWLGGFSYIVLALWTLVAAAPLVFKPRPWQPIVQCVYAVFIGHLLIHNVIDNDHWRHLFLIYGMLWGAIAAEKIAARASRRPMVMPSARTFTRYGPVLLPRAGR